MLVAEFWGLCQRACAAAPSRQRAHPGFMTLAFALAIFHDVTFYAGAPQRCRQCTRAPSLCRRARPPNARAQFRLCSGGLVRFQARLFALALVALLLCGTSGGRYYATSRPAPFVLGISGVLNRTL
jgi:hypothetical protein